jgi:hypothetical protein
VRDVLRTTVDAAALAVNSLEQQLVAKTKAAYADGVLTDEEYRQILTEAKTMAVELVKAQVGALLGAQGAKLAENLAGQAVEAAVLQRADLTQALQASTPLPPTR